MSPLQKKILVGILLAIAVGLATWSGVSAFAPQGKTIGSLGNLSEKSGTSNSATVESQPKKSTQELEKSGESAASGAPAGATETKSP